jgi:ABC-2 type transport system permease protein
MPILDQGYQHWTGTLYGHTWRWLAITRHGVRIGMKGRFLRIAIMLSWIPAIALAFMLCLWGFLERKSTFVMPAVDLLVGLDLLDKRVVADPVYYRVDVWTICYDRFLVTELWLSMLLVVMVGPSLISQDLRFNALPLYFSRPLRRVDYFVGKLGIIATFVGMVTVVPSLIAYVLGLLFSLDITIVRDTFPLLLSSIAYGLVIAVSAGLFMLALSSLSRNSRYIGLSWIGICFVGYLVALFLNGMDEEQRQIESRRAMAHQRASLQPQSPEQAQKERLAADAHQKALEDTQSEEVRANKTNWRWLVSYVDNLTRVGRHLLGTQACWEKLSELRSSSDRESFMQEHAGPRYPWYWSAAVLAGIFGLSVCILNFRVKSLDRLR